MKKLIYLLWILPFIVSCTQDSAYSKKNVALIEKYVNAVENLDYETMASLLDESYIGYGPSYGDSISKKEAVENWKYSTQYIYKSIKYSKSRNSSIVLKDGENAGEWVSNWAELTINYKWTDTPVTLWANSVYQIKNDKIIKSFTFYNEADAYRQMGFEFNEVSKN